MGKLIALMKITYKGRCFVPGEEIPAEDPELVDAWKRAGSVRTSEENMETDSSVAMSQQPAQETRGKKKK